MQIKSPKFQNTTRNFYSHQNQESSKLINSKLSHPKQHLIKSNLLSNTKHRRAASFGSTSLSQQNGLKFQKSKGNQENRLSTSYRYRNSKKTFGQCNIKRIAGRLSSMTQRQTQKEQFIRLLNSRVLETQNDPYVETFELQQDSFSHSKHLPEATCRKSKERAVSNNSIIDIHHSEQNNDKNSSHDSLVKVKTCQNESSGYQERHRGRAKTFGKDFSKLVQDNLVLQLKADNQYSKTLELHPNEINIHHQRTEEQFFNFEHLRSLPKKEITTRYPKEEEQKNQDQESQVLQMTKLNNPSSESSLRNNDTEVYEEELQQLTNDFISQWDKMNSNKSELYEKLRNKLVTANPSMRKKYSKYQLPEEPLSHKRNNSEIMSPAIQSSLRISFKNVQSESSEPNYLTVTQLHQKSVEDDSLRDKKTLKEIFKRAYFWSKTKRKCLNTTYDKKNLAVQEEKQVNNIKKNITFLSYITKRNWRKGMNQNKVRGKNIQKHKQTILEIEKSGSPQQHRLRKCLDDVIETCIRQNM